MIDKVRPQAKGAQARRGRLYKLLAVGKRELCLSEDDYRAILRANGARLEDGKFSAKTMTLTQLEATLSRLRKLGFKPRATRSKGATVASWKQARINKAYAIWCALADAGIVKNRSMASLHKWGHNITGKATLDWATSPDLSKVIEGLKSWAAREKVALKN